MKRMEGCHRQHLVPGLPAHSAEGLHRCHVPTRTGSEAAAVSQAGLLPGLPSHLALPENTPDFAAHGHHWGMLLGPLCLIRSFFFLMIHVL